MDSPFTEFIQRVTQQVEWDYSILNPLEVCGQASRPAFCNIHTSSAPGESLVTASLSSIEMTIFNFTSGVLRQEVLMYTDTLD